MRPPLRIFITTDNHIGSHENNGVRHQDASNTFDEALGIAQAQDVDLVLQCGDLFDKNKPSKMALYSTVRILRQRCLGDKPVEFEVCNDNEFMLEDAQEFNYPNYEDHNINVGLPVFAISGNHDDSGGGYGVAISPLDILSVAGLITHFGRVPNNTDIHVTPILIQKNGIKVAIYGMANVRDERLYQTFRDGGVHFHRPSDDPDSWYNILVLHQNHTYRGIKKLNPEDLVPKFFNLVVWGHEHESLIEPRLSAQRGFYVMQPGSSVVTSYHSSEAGAKYVAVVTIGEEKQMSCEKFMLKTVRPFIFRHIVLAEEAAHIDPTLRDSRRHLMQWLSDQVESMIAEANDEWTATHDANEPPMLPLIRLKVDYSYGYELENAVRFGNTFADRVANPDEILHAVRRRETEKRWMPRVTSAESEALMDENTSDMSIGQVSLLMKESLEKENLQVLMEKQMSSAIGRFVEKDDTSALKDEVSDLVKKRLDRLKLEQHMAPVTTEELADADDSSAVRPKKSHQSPSREVVEIDESDNDDRSDALRVVSQQSTAASSLSRTSLDAKSSSSGQRPATPFSQAALTAQKPPKSAFFSPSQATRSVSKPLMLQQDRLENENRVAATRLARTTRASPPRLQESLGPESFEDGDESMEMFSSSDG